MPLRPSRLAPYDTDDDGEPVAAPLPKDDRLSEAAPLAPAAQSTDNRFLRGTLTHALLEHLPAFDCQRLGRRPAKAFVAERGSGLPSRARQAS